MHYQESSEGIIPTYSMHWNIFQVYSKDYLYIPTLGILLEYIPINFRVYTNVSLEYRIILSLGIIPSIDLLEYYSNDFVYWNIHPNCLEYIPSIGIFLYKLEYFTI
jgi:hypothetical protein